MNFDHLMGRIDKPEEVEKILASAKYPLFSPITQAICGSGKGKVSLLYKYVELVLGKFPVQVQEIGDCTSFSAAHGVMTLACTEIARNGEFESYEGIPSTEDVYGGSRVLIGNGQLGNGDGSVGSWTVKYLHDYGTLIRKKYDNIDLSVYSGARARQWGNPRTGPPKLLLPYSAQHKVKTFSLVRTYEEVRDAVANGYPVLICSNVGYTNRRDKDGFLQMSGSWPHAMCVIGVDDEFKRPGCCIQNSWPFNWVTGPTRHNNPPGSFWAEAHAIERMVNEGDSYAISDYDGYPPKQLDWDLIKLMNERLKDF